MKYRFIRYCQKKLFPVRNSFEPKNQPGIRTLDNGCICHNDLAYGSTYPNSFLDLYLQSDAKEKAHPTFYMIHGGGFTWGTKEDGDPNAKSEEKDWFLRSFLDAGFNAVVIDYAYAPDYMYPTPILQISESFKFLKQVAGDYGLDMHNLVFCGGSAGGQLEGQFVNIQTNPEYAKKMDISPVLQREDIRAVLFNSALLDSERLAKTGNFAVNFLFMKCGQAYFHYKKLKGNPLVIQADIISNINKNFPPSFISDGNTATFTDQAVALSKKMEQLGIVHQLNIYSKNEKRLLHGFESYQDHYGKDNMKRMLEFLAKVGVLF